MYIEYKNTAQRKMVSNGNSTPTKDIEFLKIFYKENGNFPMFTQVLLETRTDCNRKCIFCPQSHLIRPLKIMEWHVFQRVIGDLSEIEFSGRIAFYMTNEPLLDMRLLDMIKYARSKSPRFFLDITTNGKGLTTKQVDDLFLAGLDNININDYRSDREKHPNKISNSIHKLVGDYKNNPKLTYNRRSTNETLSNYAGVISESMREIPNSFCNYPFRKLSISADGNIILCCNDYTYKTNFGNVVNRSLKEIWFSDKINQYRNDLLNGQRNGLCRGCDEFQNYSVFT